MTKVRLKQQKDRTCPITVDQYPESVLRRDVEKFTRDCPCCQKMSQLKPYIHTYKYVTVKQGVFENLTMDTIVNLPKTANGGDGRSFQLDEYLWEAV